MSTQAVISILAMTFSGGSVALNAVVLVRLSAHGTQLDWLKATLIPWLNNIGNHLNPNHTTLPGDIT